MAKHKSLDYILGMITGAALMITAWVCSIGSPLNIICNTIQEVKVVNQRWEPGYVDIIG